MNYRILVINPGSTSTKMGVFDGENCVFQETLRHSADELAPFSHVMEPEAARSRRAPPARSWWTSRCATICTA